MADFGLVKELTTEAASLTSSGLIAGTPIFMSPEQCLSKPLDGRSDLYSLGATYYALLTARPPYWATTLPMLLLQHISEETPDPRQYVPGISESCVQIIKRAMAKDPAERYQSAADMATALEQVLALAPPSQFSFLLAEENTGPYGGQRLGLMSSPTMSFLETPAGSVAETVAETVTLSPTGNISPFPQSSTEGVEIKQQRRHKTLVLLLAAAAMLLLCAGMVGFALSRHMSAKPPAQSASNDTIRVGIVHSMNGPMADVERPVYDATLLGIDELNRRGGLLGRRLEPYLVDSAADPDNLNQATENLLTNVKVAVLFGSWRSHIRKTLKNIVEKEDHLLVYPGKYEGLEDSQNILYTGATSSQYAIPALQHCSRILGVRRYFLLGSDGVFSRAVNAILTDEIHAQKGQVVGERYVLLGDVYFANVVKKIRAAKPEMIISSLQGDESIAFFRALSVAGIAAEQIPVLSLAFDESMLAELSDVDMQGHYVAGTDFSMPGAPGSAAQSFTAALSARHGAPSAVTDGTVAAYTGVHLWAQAVQAAGSAEPRKVRLALRGLAINGPGGLLRVDAGSNHLSKQFRLARINKGNRIEVIETSLTALEARIFPLSRTRTHWENFLSGLYAGWGNHWANPQQPRIPK